MATAKQKAAARKNLEKARAARKKRGTVGGVPNRYKGKKDKASRKAAAAQRRGNYLFASGKRGAAAKEYALAGSLLKR